MPTVDDSVTINAPAEKILDFITQASNMSVYDSSVVRAEQEGDGPPAVGTRTRGTTKLLGQRFDWVTELVELEPASSMAVKSVEGKIDFTIRCTVEPDGDGTRLDYHIEAASGLGGVFGRLAEPLVTKAQARQVKANLGVIKDLMES